MGSSDEVNTPPVDSSGFFRRLFKFRAVYRPDEPRERRLWWAVLLFLPPLALVCVWSDKKLLKQMALIMFYLGTLMSLPYTFSMAFFTNMYDANMPWGVILPVIIPGVVSMTSGILIAVYAQYAIIKAEEWMHDDSGI